ISDEMRRVVWSATTEQLKHYNGSAEVVTSGDGQTRVVWTADFLPDEAAPWIDSMMEQAITVMRKTLDRLAQ
ncbi:MAG: hypothetical protein JOY85_07005, partial [Acidobacteriaceae bacterium]|nr:hypothetical protein [Acidobacteriaceae bacterium]